MGLSFDILCMSRLRYQKSVKMAKAAFMSAIIPANSHNPRMLFKTFNSVVNPRPVVLRVASPALCEHFLKHFTEKKIVLLEFHFLLCVIKFLLRDTPHPSSGLSRCHSLP